MGMFRTLYVNLSCLRCGKAIDAEVQFKTGKDDLEKYSEGDFISPSHWKNANQTYAGSCTDLYCNHCFYLWRKALISTEYELLQQSVLAGSVDARLRTDGDLTAELISAMGQDAVNEIEEDQASVVYLRHAAEPAPIHRFGSVPFKFDLFFSGQSSKPGLDTLSGQDFYDLFEEQTDLALKRQGWIYGSSFMLETVVVHLDKDRRIRCRITD